MRRSQAREGGHLLNLAPSSRRAGTAMIRSALSTLSPSEQKIAEYILARPGAVVHYSITQLADAAGVGEAPVSRLCQRLGFRGFGELKVTLSQDLAPSSLDDLGPEGHSPLAVLDTALLIDGDQLERAVDAIMRASDLVLLAAPEEAAPTSTMYSTISQIPILELLLSACKARMGERDETAAGGDG